MKHEFEISEKEQYQIVLSYINNCSTQEVIELLDFIKSELNSRITHTQEGWTQYCKREKEAKK